MGIISACIQQFLKLPVGISTARHPLSQGANVIKPAEPSVQPVTGMVFKGLQPVDVNIPLISYLGICFYFYRIWPK
jgi:hypothetical protein